MNEFLLCVPPKSEPTLIYFDTPCYTMVYCDKLWCIVRYFAIHYQDMFQGGGIVFTLTSRDVESCWFHILINTQSNSLIFANKIGAKWHLILVLILIPMVTNEVELFLYMFSGHLCFLQSTCLCILHILYWIVGLLFHKFLMWMKNYR